MSDNHTWTSEIQNCFLAFLLSSLYCVFQCGFYFAADFVLPPTSSPLIRNSHGHGAISPTGSNVSVSPGPSNHGNHGNHGSHSIQPPVPHPHSAGRAMGHKPHLKVKIPSQNQVWYALRTAYNAPLGITSPYHCMQYITRYDVCDTRVRYA